ncbi:MAG: Mrp/NBP35 family ATP-binding protein [Methanosarcinales archaeon]|nr:Mrp/NBP35 family ATP-binding protein [Methanosarcinales archaeon]
MTLETRENELARHRIMVMSGKGGVGKTTVAVNLALSLATYGKNVGLLDADITGPNVPKMLGIEGQPLVSGLDGKVEPVQIVVGPDQGLSVISMAFLVGEDGSVAWRGPMKMAMLKQFVERVDWGDLDYLIVDLPPGTSDEPISIAQLLHPTGAVVVTTPHDLSMMDAARAVEMSRLMEVPVLGIVENRSGFVCPECGRPIDLFSAAGGDKRVQSMGVPVLGKVEVDPDIVRAGDRGRPIILNSRKKTAQAFEEMVRRIIQKCETGRED